MVLCQYYLNNSCRFGSKCVNDHFDVRQLIKNEVEAALKGTQWPLSCFGPFKEKPCLSNFINDQSFEEIRYLCYEAKKQNNLPAYAQQFTQEVMNAQNRMKALLALNRDVIEAVVNLYNSQDPNAAPQAQKSNPFSLGGGFGAQQANNTNSIFGNNSASANNPFASSGFGSTVQNAGQQMPVTSSGSIFGQSGFGGTNNANAFGAANNSIFGGNQPQQQQQPQQTNAFALPQLGGTQQNNQASNVFGMTGANNAFGAIQAPNAFGAQNQAPQANLFGQQNNQMQSTGLFGQAAQQQQQQPQLQAQPQNLAFAQPAQNPNIFGGSQPTSSAFSQPTTTPTSGQSIFGNAMSQAPQQQNIFAAQAQIQQQQQQQQPPVGFGGQPTNAFGVAPLQQQPQHDAGAPGGVFGGVPGQPNAFQQNSMQPFGQQNNAAGANMFGDIPDSVYSKMEDLTPEALEAFKAPEFVLGKLLTMPPPRELC